MELFIPITPVPKGRPRFSRQGHAYTPGKTRDYEEAVQFFMRSKYRGKPLEDALAVKMFFHLPRPKSSKRRFPVCRPDIDNFQKAIMDAGNGILWKDDSQIVHIIVSKIYAPGESGIRVVVDQLPEDGRSVLESGILN